MKNKRITVLSHATGWILFLSLPILFITGQVGNKDFLAVLGAPPTWLFILTYTIIFYFNTYFLLPHLYKPGKYLLYAATVLILFAAVFFLRPFDKMVSYVSRDQQRTAMHPPRPPDDGPPGRGFEDRPPPPHERDGGRPAVDVVSIFLFLMIMALSLAIHIRQRLRYTEQRALKAEADKANAELSFLKAQINPHFLFNTLNNIYSLAITKNEHTAESIMKLSNIMRYVTDDISEDYVELENELACISDYIDLQKLRLGPATKVELQVSGTIAGKKIAPLILMTFVENVFKYGISNHAASEIMIRVATDEKGIRFFSRNHIFATARNTERTGIGIANTRQRLEHLYPGKHSLLIDDKGGYFSVELYLTI